MHIFIYDEDEFRISKFSESLDIDYIELSPHYIHFITMKKVYINNVLFVFDNRFFVRSIKQFDISFIKKCMSNNNIIVFEFDAKIDNYRVVFMIENIIESFKGVN